MRHIEVATEHHGLACVQALEVGSEVAVPSGALRNPRQVPFGIGNVGRHDKHIVKLRGNYSAFALVLLYTHSVGHAERLALADQCGTRIPFFFSLVGDNVVARAVQNLFGLIHRALNLLKTHDVWVQIAYNFEQTLACDRPKAVYIPRNNVHVPKVHYLECMLRALLIFSAAVLGASCATTQTEQYALAQNPSIQHSTSLRKGANGTVFIQEYVGISSMLGMDRQGSLRRHVLVTADGTQVSHREGGTLHLPSGQIPVPDSLYHLSGLTAVPLLVPQIIELPEGATVRTTASTAPAGDLTEVEWLCSLRTPTQRHYVARYEVTTAELRYAKIRGRWTLESAEYSEREYVQRWNRVPRQ